MGWETECWVVPSQARWEGSAGGDVRKAGGPVGMGTDAGSFRRMLGGKGAPGGEVREAGGPCGMGTDAGSFRRRLGEKGVPGGR